MMMVNADTTIRKLHRMRFPQQDHTSLRQALDDRGVGSSDVILQQVGASGGRQTFNVEKVLGSIRNPVQGAHILASLQGQFRSLRLGQGTLTRHQLKSV
jgi:hypothetical protein